MASPLRRFTFATFVAFRLVRSRRSPRLSTVTMLSMAGVAFGVMALTVVLGVTGGFQSAFQERILGLYPHVVVLKRAGDFRDHVEVLSELRQTPGVVAASPATYDDMMIAAGVARAGAVIKGVELSTVDKVIGVESLLTSGSLDSLGEAPTATVEGSRVAVDGVVNATWMTVVLTDAGPSLLYDDRTPPNTGNARVSVLDLRPKPATRVVTLEPVAGDGEDDPPLVGRIVLGPTREGELSRSQEARAGTWMVDVTGELVDLTDGTLATLVLLAPGADGAARSRLTVEPARVPMAKRTGMVRLVDGRTSGGPMGLASAKGEARGPAVAPGEFTGFVPYPGRFPGILLGSELAERLDVEIGDDVTLVTPLRGVDNKMLGPYGMAPSSSRHVVTGTFESGFYEYDARLALVNLTAAQRFLNRGDVIRWIEVRTEDLLKAADVKRTMHATIDPFHLETLVGEANRFEGKLERYLAGDVRGTQLGSPDSFVGGFKNAVQLVNLLKYQETDFGHRARFRLIDWKEMNTNLFSALKLQKVVLTIFFLIIIVVGSFVVVGSQVMVIHEKTPDIAILKAMGATAGVIRAVFTLQGLFVAGAGTVVGLVAGVGLCALLDLVDYRLDAAVYFIDRLPVQLDRLDLVIVAVMTGLCTLLATQYSAGRAAAKTPVEGLQALD